MQLFHYHLVTSKAREVEARYIGKLGFDLVARHGRIGEDLTSYEPGTSWDELDAAGFKLRLSELELGAVNVVIQPGQWPLPRVDHIGIALDDDEYELAVARGRRERAPHPGARRAGARSSPPTPATGSSSTRPGDWIDDLLGRRDRLRLAELHLKADDPETKAERARGHPRPRARRAATWRSATRSSASSTAARRGGRSCTASCSSDPAGLRRAPL